MSPPPDPTPHLVIVNPEAPSTPDPAACAHAIIRLRIDGPRAWYECEWCQTPFAPVSSKGIDPAPAPEYLSVQQLSKRIPYSEGAIRNLMSRGVFQVGRHYTKPQGRPIFCWRAVQQWLAQEPGAA